MFYKQDPPAERGLSFRIVRGDVALISKKNCPYKLCLRPPSNATVFLALTAASAFDFDRPQPNRASRNLTARLS